MQLGSKEHKAQFCEQLIKVYYENIWQDEMHLTQIEGQKADKRKEIADIEAKLERKEYKTANEGNKAKFVAERELEHMKKETDEILGKLKTWQARIEFVKEYLKNNGKAN